MQNKLGILDDRTLEQIEELLIKNKIMMLNYEFTFNESEYNFNFLVKIHEYLFASIYDFDNHHLNSYVDDNIINEVNKLLRMLSLKGIIGEFDHESLEILYLLWQMQIFINGNTRTLIAFLKIYISAFRLESFIDFKDIEMLWKQGFSFQKIRIK